MLKYIFFVAKKKQSLYGMRISHYPLVTRVVELGQTSALLKQVMYLNPARERLLTFRSHVLGQHLVYSAY